MSPFNSCIYSGFVTHRRFKPKRHFFTYKTFSLLINLHEIENLGKKIKFFSYNKFNILSFYDADHGPRNGDSLINWVKNTLAEANINIGSGNEVSILNLAKIIAKVVGFGGKFIF